MSELLISLNYKVNYLRIYYQNNKIALLLKGNQCGRQYLLNPDFSVYKNDNRQFLPAIIEHLMLCMSMKNKHNAKSNDNTIAHGNCVGIVACGF